MARPPARTALTTAGVGTAALLLAAAAAAPALADGNGNSGNNGNHYGQTKDHSNNGESSSNDASSSSTQTSTTSTTSSDGTSTGHNPPGNNGTVFIHDVQGDETPHNVPHVGCTFYVDFFGFDANQQATVSFAGQAPTGKDTQLSGGWSGTVSTTDAGGAGNDFDKELTFTADELNVGQLGTPAQQGYHIKMTVVTNEPGDHKYKVFWMQPCTQTAATSNTDTAPSDTTTGTEAAPTSVGTLPSMAQSGGETSSAGQSSGAATVLATTASRKAGIPTQVLGRSITRGSAPAATPAAASLPFTGAEIGGMAAAALAALAGGTALTVAGRRRRTRGEVSPG